MADITIERLKTAVAEEKKGLPISDATVQLLQKHVQATDGRVVGTDNLQYSLQSEIWSTSIVLGPPAIWSMINLNDSHNSLVQAFCGEQINLDDFIATMGPDKEQCARNINMPSSDELLELFKSEVFPDKMRAFIKANICAYCPGLKSAESVKAICSDQAAGFTRPPNPNSTTYADEVKMRELALARTLQVHTCQMRRCLQFDKHSKLVCKRKSPWATANEDFVDELGQWGAKWFPATTGHKCNEPVEVANNHRDHEAEAQLPHLPTCGVQAADDGTGHRDDDPNQSTLVHGHKFICMAVVF
ncbi:hypothetical protein PHLCEN_2v1323 [Hermanssonia centrifuga]|uniref:Uncharacterized protein n=1 Tax=Hermanssonia centrifuga TaxID=98765 RepID=A0A2R6S3K5_9APHY|nr:hypothetical protein PHLCEN_2v1323 [Hermanssonia centrifuga]